MTQDTQQAVAAWKLADAGDIAAAAELIGNWSKDASPCRRAWASALLLHLSLVTKATPSPPAPTPEHLSHPDALDALAYGVGPAIKCAVLALDMPQADRAARWLRSVGDQRHPQVMVAAQWQRMLAGECSQAASDLREVERLSATLGDAACTVEAASLRALALLTTGNLVDALATARRAVRMARTEAMAQGEYLAAIVLARTRRLCGQAHAASRILAALRRYVPPSWHPWVDWELVMASGLGARLVIGDAPVVGPARLLLLWLEAARNGDRAQFSDTKQRLRQQCALPWIAADIDRAEPVVDPDLPLSPDPCIQKWKLGAVHEVPFGLAALASSETEQTCIAHVIAGRPDAIPCRVLTIGASLAASTSDSSRVAIAKHVRTQVLVAVIALAGDAGLSEEDAFDRAYQFSFRPELHSNVFNVAIHRARSRLKGAELLRENGRLRLVFHHPMALADPRCVEPLSNRVLRVIAMHGTADARLVADALSVSLRGVQAALETLVEDGACLRQRSGRNITYVVEDTTFQEPTAQRRLPI